MGNLWIRTLQMIENQVRNFFKNFFSSFKILNFFLNYLMNLASVAIKNNKLQSKLSKIDEIDQGKNFKQ
jgi:amino acid permease